MNILHICSPHLSDVASSHFNLGNPKKSFFSTVSFVHTSDLPFLGRKQIATAALQLSCLLYCLPIICISLLPRLGHATWGAHVSSISPRYGQATTAAFATWADFSTAWCMMRLISGEQRLGHVSMLKVATLNTCFDAVCLLPVATHHNRLFSEPPTTFERTQQAFSHTKKVLHFTS